MLPPIELDPEQEEAVERMIVEPTHAALVASDTGTGKTVKVVEFIRRTNAQTVLLIAPPKTKGSARSGSGWLGTLIRQGIDLPFREITSDKTENFDLLRNNERGVYFISREFFTLSGSTLVDEETEKVIRVQRWDWRKVKPDVAVFDEVQKASNRKSTTYKVLKHLHAGYRIATSATPQGNKFQGIWAPCRWLWPTTIDPATGDPYVDTSFWRWAATWAEVVPDPYTYKKVTKELNEGAFVNSLPCYIRLEAERTPVEVRKVYVELTPSQRRLYDKMEQDMLVWLDDHPLVADVPIVQRARMRQITLGEVSFNSDDEVDFADECDSSKIDAVEKIIAKHHPNDPLFILVDSQRFARVLTHRLGPKAAEYSGRLSHKARENIVHEFGKSVQFLVATIPAVAEGLDGLQEVCHVEVWLNQSLNEMLNEQARGRVNRRGQKADKIIRYYLMARGTDDDDHFQRLLDQHIEQRATLKKYERRTA